MSIGKRIRALRTEQGLTQKQLGERCGMSDAEIRKFESDRGSPTVRSLQRIADALGCSVGYLADGQADKERRQILKMELLALLEDEDVKKAITRIFTDSLSRAFSDDGFNY